MEFTHIANPVRVRAVRILGVRGSCDYHILDLENENMYKADAGMTARYMPVPGDYLVTQEDGYTYVNPKDVFERKYSPISDAAGLPPIEGVLGDVRIVPAAGATPTPSPIAAAPADRWKPTIGRIVTVKGYIANGSDEHPGIITRVFGAGEGALVNVTVFPDLQSPKILNSIPAYTSRAAARDAVVGPSRANGFAFFPDRG